MSDHWGYEDTYCYRKQERQQRCFQAPDDYYVKLGRARAQLMAATEASGNVCNFDAALRGNEYHRWAIRRAERGDVVAGGYLDEAVEARAAVRNREDAQREAADSRQAVGSTAG